VPAHENIDGERKTVTVLFSDIKGSMELIEDLDPEEARAIVDPALKVMIETVQHYGGYVAQSTGDGIFALFGAPVAYEDHPQRALYAALRMQEELKHYSDRIRAEGRLPIQARVGVNTGEVVVRSITTGEGRTEYVPVGHSTGIAARMQALAPVGSIAATEQIRKLCDGYFLFKSLGPTKVKGVSEPVSVYEVTGLGPLRTRLQRAAARGYTKFVGRDREMETLRRAGEQAKEGHGQLVCVVAEPGVGKSRLFYEFKARNQSGWMVLEAFSVSQGKASAYTPVIDLLHSYCGIAPEDDTRTRREKVNDKVLTLDRELEDALPYLFGLLGLTQGEDPLAGTDARIRRQRTLEALKRILLRESLNQPLMVVFEDLHWIDGETQAFLNLLADSIGTAKLLLLMTYRPEYSHSWSSKTYYIQLRLDPLGSDSAGEMFDALLDVDGQTIDAPLVALKRLIIEKTEGTPLFMEEIHQALIEEGALIRNGAVKLARPLNEVKIPTTVQAILASRIDRLPAAEKEILQTLAVIGVEFPLALVREVTRKPDDELNRILSDLQLAEFIYEQPAVGGIEYTFKHALTQDVAYKSVLVERRKAVHERAGQALESMFAQHLSDHLGDLAHHYSRSGNLTKAIDYSVRAGETAYRVSAFIEAALHLHAALKLMDEQGGGEPKLKARVLFLLGDENVTPAAQGVEYLETLVELQEKQGDYEAAATSRIRLVLYLVAPSFGLMDVPRAIKHFKVADERFRKQADSVEKASFYVQWAACCIWLRRTHDGISAGRRAMEIAARLGNERQWAYGAILSSLFLMITGSVNEGLELASQARARAESINDTMLGSTVAWTGGDNYLGLADPLEAQRWYTSELAKRRYAQAPRRRAILQSRLVWASTMAGDLAGARRYAAELGVADVYIAGVGGAPSPILMKYEGQWEEAERTWALSCERSHAGGDRHGESGDLFNLGELERLRGNYTRAAEWLERGLAIGVEAGDLLYELAVRSALALVYSEIHRADEALAQIDRCRDILAAGEDWRGIAGRFARAEAVVVAGDGRHDEAERSFSRAQEIFRRYTLPWDEAETFLYWGRALKAAGDSRADEKFHAAIEIYRRHGAGERWIERVENERQSSRPPPIEAGR
jgi:class 3 adenylate cyclase/tetratricopeptide (TPR) repeat protein